MEPSRALTYGEALELLEGALTFGINPSLDGIRALVGAMGDPHSAYGVCQVTGTNGKTSVTRLLAALLSAHGLKTGAYTSPHLVSYVERMEVDGAPVTEAAFAAALGAADVAARAVLEHSAQTLGVAAESLGATFTEFELLTAAALWLYREQRVDWAVLEVGMGGRWDATSVTVPAVAVVTGVALDHTERLGSTREAIAADKAHIIKRGSVAVLGPGCAGVEDILFSRAREMGAEVVRVGRDEDDVTWEVVEAPTAPGGPLRLTVTGVRGRYEGLEVRAPAYQAPNIATAVAAAEAALGRPLDAEAIARRLAAMRFPGRFELVRPQPPLVIDGAHNPEAAGVLARSIAGAFGGVRPAIVLGVLADKDAAGIVRALAPVAARFVCAAPTSSRALPAADLAAVVAEETDVAVEVKPSIAAALLAVSGEPAVVTGSTYTAGEARGLILG